MFLGAQSAALAAEPPFGATEWLDSDIIHPSDWTAYQRLSYSGIASRDVYDRRDNVYMSRPMHIFNATYAEAPQIEVQVNSNDFSQSVAGEYAASYAETIGRLPTPLRDELLTITIHGGGALPFGGANFGILVHVDVEPATVDFLEEILFHEVTHAVYGDLHDMSPAWNAAQDADPTFISDYARQYPDREDVAETLIMWYALRYRSDRLDAATIAATEAAIPNRLAYLDALEFEFSESTPGDINFDGDVDASDYVLWRENSYRTLTQYEVWRAHFGQLGGNGTGQSVFTTSVATPEPAGGFSMLVVAIQAILYLRGRRSLTSG